MLGPNMMGPYFAIVTYGSHTYGRKRSFYRSFKRAKKDADSLGGGSLMTVRVVACPTRAEARMASIADGYPIHYQR